MAKKQILDKDITRIEVWYNNGLFRAYPEVNGETFDFNSESRVLGFEFGKNGHGTIINLNNVNFIEFMCD